jgi:histidinol-phosphate aminotransferase
MDLSADRSWSCYPDGLHPTRRAFLKALAVAAAAAGTSFPILSCGQESPTAGGPIPAIPPGGFPEGSTRLNFNENPLGPSNKAIAALLETGFEDANRYNFIDPLIEAIAGHLDMPFESLLVGCGSTEFLQFAPWAFLRDGGDLVMPAPSYGWSGMVAESMGRRVVRAPTGELGVVDTVRLKKSITRDTRIVYVANPNNPTGAPIPHQEIVSLADALPSGAVLMVDQAYHDFLPDGDSILDLVRAGEPVLVLRTFSKAYGMAGLRLGYAIGSDSVLAKLRTVWWGDFGINTASRIAGPAALADQEHVRNYVKLVDEGLAQLRAGLTDLGVRSYPYRAPFFMADFGKPTTELVRSLTEQQIYVRPGEVWGMPNFMRISVGTARDNETFLEALREILVEGQ